MLLFAVLVSAFAVAGCGHSEDEWQQAQRDIAKLKADLDAANKRHADDEQKYATRSSRSRTCKAKLKDLGVGLSKSEEEKAKLTHGDGRVRGAPQAARRHEGALPATSSRASTS